MTIYKFNKAKECCATNYHGNYKKRDKLRVFCFSKDTIECKRSLFAISKSLYKENKDSVICD